MFNPFAKKENKKASLEIKKVNQDPLAVEDLLVDGTQKATITSDGRLVTKKDALKDKEEHIDLLKTLEELRR